MTKTMIDSDTCDLIGREFWILVDDDGTIVVHATDRSVYPPTVTTLVTMTAGDAHHLGTKLRLAAKKARSRP